MPNKSSHHYILNISKQYIIDDLHIDILLDKLLTPPYAPGWISIDNDTNKSLVTIHRLLSFHDNVYHFETYDQTGIEAPRNKQLCPTKRNLNCLRRAPQRRPHAEERVKQHDKDFQNKSANFHNHSRFFVWSDIIGSLCPFFCLPGKRTLEQHIYADFKFRPVGYSHNAIIENKNRI
ncbi:MAG: hypothetical protein JXD23_09995 [Spirochaetales bacterium]|nr:hypothetical protein [Spirochaetales bacterium]